MDLPRDIRRLLLHRSVRPGRDVQDIVPCMHHPRRVSRYRSPHRARRCSIACTAHRPHILVYPHMVGPHHRGSYPRSHPTVRIPAHPNSLGSPDILPVRRTGHFLDRLDYRGSPRPHMSSRSGSTPDYRLVPGRSRSTLRIRQALDNVQAHHRRFDCPDNPHHRYRPVRRNIVP